MIDKLMPHYDWEGDAIRSLVPTAQYFRNAEGIHWDLDENNNVSCPTESEIDAEVIRLKAEYDAQEYARNRESEYPALAEQLDEIYHNGIDSWKALIKVTKDKYPKG
jgi:hypothetical protein